MAWASKCRGCGMRTCVGAHNDDVVRGMFAGIMLATMDADQEWTRTMHLLAKLDGSTP